MAVKYTTELDKREKLKNVNFQINSIDLSPWSTKTIYIICARDRKTIRPVDIIVKIGALKVTWLFDARINSLTQFKFENWRFIISQGRLRLSFSRSKSKSFDQWVTHLEENHQKKNLLLVFWSAYSAILVSFDVVFSSNLTVSFFAVMIGDECDAPY